MKKIIFIIALGLTLSGCAFFKPHKIDIEQGNVITQEEVSRLHSGMTEAQVKNVMGTPTLVNIFSTNQIDYVYTLQHNYNPRIEKKAICHFQHGRLTNIQTSY